MKQPMFVLVIFLLLGDAGWIYLLEEDGYTVSDSVAFDLQGYKVEYSGYGLAVPRTGTPPGNVMDVVFPTDNGLKWIYFAIPLDSLFTGTAVKTDQAMVPERFTLMQPYPNPFNPVTRVNVTLNEEAVISLRVVDLKGRTVKTILHDEVRQAGSYSCSWHGKNDNGHDVPSGTYLLVLTAGPERQIRKVTLLK